MAITLKGSPTINVTTGTLSKSYFFNGICGMRSAAPFTVLTYNGSPNTNPGTFDYYDTKFKFNESCIKLDSQQANIFYRQANMEFQMVLPKKLTSYAAARGELKSRNGGFQQLIKDLRDRVAMIYLNIIRGTDIYDNDILSYTVYLDTEPIFTSSSSNNTIVRVNEDITTVIIPGCFYNRSYNFEDLKNMLIIIPYSIGNNRYPELLAIAISDHKGDNTIAPSSAYYVTVEPRSFTLLLNGNTGWTGQDIIGDYGDNQLAASLAVALMFDGYANPFDHDMIKDDGSIDWAQTNNYYTKTPVNLSSPGASFVQVDINDPDTPTPTPDGLSGGYVAV